VLGAVPNTTSSTGISGKKKEIHCVTRGLIEAAIETFSAKLFRFHSSLVDSVSRSSLLHQNLGSGKCTVPLGKSSSWERGLVIRSELSTAGWIGSAVNLPINFLCLKKSLRIVFCSDRQILSVDQDVFL
jgi:hypothetical protein